MVAVKCIVELEKTILNIKNSLSLGSDLVLSGQVPTVIVRPFCLVEGKQKRADIELFSRLRKQYKRSFFTWIESTMAETTRWINSSYCPNSQDIIFILETEEKQPVGTVSLYGIDAVNKRCELGRIMKDSTVSVPGIMTIAIHALLRWARLSLSLESVYLEVFADNSSALRLYERCGLNIRKKNILYSRHINGIRQWSHEECDSSANTCESQWSYFMERSLSQD